MIEIITYIVIGSGLLATLVLLLKKSILQGTNQNDRLVNYMMDRDEKRDQQYERKDEQYVGALNKNSEAIEKLAESIRTSLVDIVRKMGDTNGTLLNRIDNLSAECRSVKTTMTETHDHLVSKWNKMDDQWMRTRDVIRSCEKKKE